MSKTFRIGQIVPSSNTTMETEIPAMLRAREAVLPERFTFHSSRMRMKKVTREELACMDKDSDRCAMELADARVDVMAYACLVAIMSMGNGYHRESAARLSGVASENNCPVPVVTSAGALCDALSTMGAKTLTVVCPYMRPLAEVVMNYIANEGFAINNYQALEIADNLAVGIHDPNQLPAIVETLDYHASDVIVLSACVQMPSLPVVEIVEQRTGKPVLTASIATTYAMLKKLGLDARVPGAGSLLSGRY